MIDNILSIVKLIIAILPFVILCLASNRVNLPHSERSKQFAMPVISVVYSIAAMLLINPINNWLLKIIKNLPKWINSLAGLIASEDFDSAITSISNAVQSLIEKLNLNFWIFFISNTVIIIAYLLIKKICLKIIAKTVKNESELHTRVAELFYEFFYERNKWCLKEEYVQTRSLLKVFYYCAVILSATLMAVSSRFYFEGLLKSVFYPVFGVLIVGELFFYLDDITKKEYSGEILGEDEEAYRIVNYSLLRRFLRSIFGDKLLAENTTVNNSLAYDLTTEEIIHDLERSDDQKIVSFAAYIDALNRTGFQIDHKYLYSSLDLLNGKSILFNNPFYNDLIPYAFYPMNRALLSHKKVLVVLGRHSVEDDITDWLERGIEAVTNIPFLWNIGILNGEKQDLDIGIVTRSEVLNIKMQNANSEFLENVGFFVIIEPSKIISTAQIGLNMLAKKCRVPEDKSITFCICDQNCDGLVDALSHILMTGLTEVSATGRHLGTSSHMCWEADGECLQHRIVPNVSRYLGMGTELSLAALKNQVSKTQWYGGEAFPVSDIRWISKQYFYELTKYAGLPTGQEELDERFFTSSNFWSADIEKNSYLIVEDESNNMFEVLREFSTRTTEQGFINVISPEYLLKDYMADNASIFEADAKAIPLIVPDYTRSNRNTVLRLVLMMSTAPVAKDVLEKEFSLLGITVFDLKMQIWYELYNCYSKAEKSLMLPKEYEKAVQRVATEKIVVDDGEWDIDIICIKNSYNLRTGKTEVTYYVSDQEFIKQCVNELTSAEYVSEDEKGGLHYLGAELRGQIYQKYLPGQFFTLGGKYYEMQYLTAAGQILVRRAADHITGRPSYRQIREYVIHGTRPSEKIGSVQNVSGMRIVKEFADVSVSTHGYYRMKKYNDFSTAKKISFEGDGNGIPDRIYRNKEILRIDLPEANGGVSDNVRYTITLLFNEIFRTLFADNQAYICAVTDESFMSDKDEINPLTYSVKGDGCEIKKDSIYFIEDSQLDLGLTVAIERNLQRILGMINDYLEWHKKAFEESINPPEEPQSDVVFGEAEPEEESKNGFIASVKRFFKKMKDKRENKKDKKKNIPTVEEINPEEETGSEITEEITDDVEVDPAGEAHSVEKTELTEMPFEEDVYQSDDDQKDTFGFSTERPPYYERYYLLYGMDSELPFLDLDGTLQYLTERGFDQNELKQARNGKEIAAMIEATYKPGKPDARYCDFCGTEIYGVEYETLSDGRDRCLSCGRTAIKSVVEFRKIFEDVKRNMEAFFGIRINVGIRVEMVNSKTLHKRLGKAFVPTPNQDGRVLGVAINDKEGYTLLIENGSPRMASMLTMAHELTHIWQYINWNDKAIRKKYGKKMRLEIYEGMAKWVEIQYAYLINEVAVAKREELITAYRDDEYGHGFLRYRANYPFSTGTVITKPTPFLNIDTPLSPEYCGTITVRMPTNGINPGDINNDPPAKRRRPIGNVPKKKTGSRTRKEAPKYAFSLLNDEEKNIYLTVLNALNDFAEEINLSDAKITEESAGKIISYIKIDHPEIFWYRHGATFYFDSETHIVNRIRFVYCMSRDEAQTRKKKVDTIVDIFMNSLSDDMSEYEVALSAYEDIIKLVDYDTIGLERQSGKIESPEVSDDLRSIYGVFINRKAVCSGYAKAYQYLLNQCGIECAYVTSDTHAWNLVKLEGDYYHLDVTWGDSSDTKNGKNQNETVNYDCFCMTTEEVLRLDSHKPDNTVPIPNCTATRCNYHRRNGLYFDSYDYESVKNAACKYVGKGKTDVSFKFGSEAVYKLAKKSLIDNDEIRKIITQINSSQTVKFSPNYSYATRDDRWTVVFFLKK